MARGECSRGSIYSDQATVMRNGERVQGWERIDYLKLQPGERTGEKFGSVQSLYRYDGARLNLAPIEIDYRPLPLRIVDNGHTVQINNDAGSSIRVRDTRYELKQIQFHNPAEVVVNGKAFSLSVHFVHEPADKRLAVVAALFEPGEENAFLSALWARLPLEPHREIVLASVRLDWTELLPADRRYYTYMGSLTTPPCSEGVLCLVMKAPLLISPEQINVFARRNVMNARPVQESNGRLIKESL